MILEFHRNLYRDEDDVEVEDTADVQNAVTLKSVGCTQDKKYQRSLERINELLMTRELKLKNTDCRVKPEPENPVEARAISIECHVDWEW